MSRRPGTYGPGYGEAALCNMHNLYLRNGKCRECEATKVIADAAARYVDCQESGQHADCKAGHNCHGAGECLRLEELVQLVKGDA